MSSWTHITSCLSIDTCIESDDIINIVKDYLNKGPQITGSEGNADVFVNLQSGYNVYLTGDCGRCEYKDSFKKTEDNIFECNAPDDYKCPDGNYQSCVVISIQGDLRDRTPERTQKEFNKFLNYLDEKYIIRDYSLNIQGE